MKRYGRCISALLVVSATSCVAPSTASTAITAPDDSKAAAPLSAVQSGTERMQPAKPSVWIPISIEVERAEQALKAKLASVYALDRFVSSDGYGDAYASDTVVSFERASEAWHAYVRTDCDASPLLDGMTRQAAPEVTQTCIKARVGERLMELKRLDGLLDEYKDPRP